MKSLVFALSVAMLFGSNAVKATQLSGPDGNIVETNTSAADNLLSAQVPPPAPWCYTPVGRFPMVVALPPGVACQVAIAVYPYVVAGTTGY
jgi:hypothetical protein